MYLSFEKNEATHFSISIPTSKSISNRASILEALSNYNIQVINGSESNDSAVMRQLLQLDSSEKNTQDAGTVMRFLCAYYCISNESKEIILKGTKRMHSRPIKPLVDALRELGANIEYLEKEGFPPLRIHSKKGLKNPGKIHISNTMSSQFISALMLIAPKISGGLELSFEKSFPSFPYLSITAELMKKCGLEVVLENGQVKIPEQSFKKAQINVESDWSSTSYFYSIVALRKDIRLLLKGLKLDSIQGDSKCAEIYEKFGVKSIQSKDGVEIYFNHNLLEKSEKELSFDFRDNPDLTMSVLTCLAARKQNARIRGIENLIFKESDRIQSLISELGKFSCVLEKIDAETWYLNSNDFKLIPHTVFNCHQDHRMAMSFALFAFIETIGLDEPEVVNKSFPGFWEELGQLGLHRS